MAFKIGFTAEHNENDSADGTYTAQQQTSPRKSVVQIYFDDRNMTLAYYNDRFDLHRGDMVYVDGKLEGMLGCVTEVNYNFKIKISDYKRVIAVADTTVHGKFFIADGCFVTFDREALPSSKVVRWFKAPANEGEEIVSGSDNTTFRLEDIKKMKVSYSSKEFDNEQYYGNNVRYISLDGTRGYAIVEGHKAYEVEFEYCNGEISGLVCSCFNSDNCKHEFAAMLLLKEMLELIEKNYADEYERSGYFAAINKRTLFNFAVCGKDSGTFTL